MKFLDNKKPKSGWIYRLMKINVAMSHYLSGKISKRHNEELWTFMSKNPETFEELVIRKKMEKALKSGKLQDIIENWDKFAEIMNMDKEQLQTDEKIDEVYLGTSKVLKDISNKLKEYHAKTGREEFPWAGHIDPTENQPQQQPAHNANMEKPAPKTSKIWAFYKKHAAAAVVLFMISMGISTYFFFPGQPNDAIYEQYYTPYEFHSKDNSSLFSGFIKLYQEKKFIAARETLQAITVDDPFDHMIKEFYTGLSYLGNHEYNQAVESLRAVADSEYESRFKDEALWYMGLAYLKIGADSRAYQAFSTLKTREIPNKRQVKRVIRKMR